jgi:hypothetical protein
VKAKLFPHLKDWVHVACGIQKALFGLEEVDFCLNGLTRMALTGTAATLGQAKAQIKKHKKNKKNQKKRAKAEKNGILYMMKPRHP